MHKLEVIALLFTDTFFANLAISFKGEIIIHVIKAFRNLSDLMILGVVVFATLVANVLNYLLGIVIFNIFSDRIDDKRKQSILLKEAVIYRYRYFLLLFSAVPIVGSLIIVGSGFSRIKFTEVLSVIFLLKLLYYIWLINYH